MEIRIRQLPSRGHCDVEQASDDRIRDARLAHDAARKAYSLAKRAGADNAADLLAEEKRLWDVYLETEKREYRLMSEYRKKEGNR